MGYQAAYEAFGTRTQTDGATIDRQAANTKEEDPTGFLNEGMLATGVFLTRDPAGFVDGPNLYAYVRQNPWSKFDPEGLFMFGLHDNAGDYFSEVGQVWKGYGQAGGDFVGGIAHTVAHPIQTAQGIGTAVAHPVATAKAVGGAINESWNSGLQGQGRVVGNVLIAVGTAAAPFAEAGEAAAAANAVTRLEEAGEVGTSAARTAEKAAELARKSGACFPAGTLVATPAGELPIETLREGEQVYAFDFERGEVVPRTVLKTYLHFTYCWVDIQAGDETITATRGHRFWVESEQRWIAALELQPGMAARLQDGRSVTITATALRELTQSEPTFNLEVERDHDYFVGASKVLVHNGDIEKVGPHEVGPYEDVGGHHPHQQAARSNNPNYDPQKAVPVKPGTYDHSEISRVQQRMNAQAAKSGAVYNLEAEEAIQRAAMKAGGMAEPEIERVLELSRQQLKTQGALEPSRIPGTPKKGC